MEVSGQTFEHLSKLQGQVLLQKLNATPVEKDQFQPSEKLVENFHKFITQYIDTQRYVSGVHTPLWTEESIQDIPGTIAKILTPESHPKAHTLRDWFYQLSTHLMMDNMGGFLIQESPTRDQQIDATQYLMDHKIPFLQDTIKKQLHHSKLGFLFCPEWDFGDIDLSNTNIKMRILDPQTYQGNSGKAIFYTDDLRVKEISPVIIRQTVLNQYDEEMGQLLDKHQSKFAVVRVDEIIMILVHLKAVGNQNDILKNQELYYLLCQIRDMYSYGPVVMMGDFNLPLPSEEKGQLKLNSEILHKYPFRDEPSWFSWMYQKIAGMLGSSDDYLNRGFYRALYQTSDIVCKIRTDNPFYNSQAFRNKFYGNSKENPPRMYHTDQILTNFAKPFKTQLYPTPQEIPSMPYVGEDLEQSWLSDHQMITCQVPFYGKNYSLGVFNVLSKCCTEKSPLKSELSLSQRDSAQILYHYLLSELWNELNEQRVV